MKWISPVGLVLLASCGGTSLAPRATPSPMLSGDLCALHQEATSCRGDPQGCSWYPNTRACPVDGPCPPGWCSGPETVDAGTGVAGGVAASAGCACPGAGGDACVEELGGPAPQQPPAVVCAAVPASCASPDRCRCLSGAALGTCDASEQVTNLCLCDGGLR